MLRSAAPGDDAWEDVVRCPKCHAPVKDSAWLCASCDHIIDPSFLGEDVTGDAPRARAEPTQLVAWSHDDESVPDAVILGDVAVDSSEFAVVQGAGASSDGRTATYLFYTAGATSRIIHPDSIPLVAHRDTSIPHTPYEDFILSCVDGERSVRAIKRLSGLAPQEVVVTLLTLLDKGAIKMRPAPLEEAEESEQTEDFPIEGAPPEERRFDTELVPVVPTKPEPHASEDLPTHSAAVPLAAAPVRPRAAPTDFEDLPSVSDFHELPDANDSAEIAVGHELEAPTRQLSSLSGVWAEPRASTRAPVVPTSSLEGSEEMTTKSRAVPRRARIASEEGAGAPHVSLPGASGAEDQRGREPSARSQVAGRPPSNLGAPLLDLAFLEEVPPSSPGMPDALSAIARGEAAATPTAEPVARISVERAEIARPVAQPVEGAPPGEPADEPRFAWIRSARGGEPARPAAEPVDRHRMLKAQKLYEQALKDRAEGNLVSARMNMKLALTFDPNHEECHLALEEISKNPEARPVDAGRARNRARELYDAATTAENRGDVEGAIRHLEEAIKVAEQPAFYNRLGVIIAMKKRDFGKAQELIGRALELAPGNPSYSKNLHKILGMAATATPERIEKKGLLGLLGRRR